MLKNLTRSPSQRGKALLTSPTSSSDLIPGPSDYKSTAFKLSRPRYLGKGVSLDVLGFIKELKPTAKGRALLSLY